ncbi:MAG TPA: DUF1569 domain-containing protein [Longimicrobiales bacterium]|nr:DUF1569 domain-containing protein [Longimicrobiales bacterium]
MPSIHEPTQLEHLKARLAGVTPDSPRLWGRMSPHQMICHLADAFRFALGEREVAAVRFPLPAPLVRVLALRLPIPWPKGSPTAREMDQDREGTRPGDFLDDRRALADLMDRFSATRDGWPRHPVMGEMSLEDWGRWGWLHTDHHLRQFGA